MAITLGSFSCNTLTAQPFGYYEADTTAGLTARKWRISGLCTNTQWSALLSAYNSWRNTRINDEDTLKSRVVGTTINLSVAAAGQSWTSVPCWFLSAPSAEQVGAYLSVNAELVDAAQYLALLLAQEEKNKDKQDALKPDLGTITIGEAVITLTKPPHTYTNNPQVQLTATGQHYISGPLRASRVRDVEGTCNATNWEALQEWYEDIVTTTPGVGTWYPTSPPAATAAAELMSGVKTTVYTVTIQLIQL